MIIQIRNPQKTKKKSDQKKNLWYIDLVKYTLNVRVGSSYMERRTKKALV